MILQAGFLRLQGETFKLIHNLQNYGKPAAISEPTRVNPATAQNHMGEKGVGDPFD